MKKTLTIAILFSSASAVAHPLDPFVGTYGLKEKPTTISNKGIRCEWLKGLQSVELRKEAESYAISFSQIVSASPVAFSYDFSEYNYKGPFGESSTAKITGDAASAKYEVVHTSGRGEKEIQIWTFSRSASDVTLSVFYSHHEDGGCQYLIRLK